jgi:hypothetical protein
MKTLLSRIPEQIIRLLVVFLVLAGGMLLLSFLLPPTLTEDALYTKAANERESAKTIRHAGSDVCATCHDEYTVVKAGYHRNLSCETCHGPSGEHAEDPMEKNPRMPRLREHCARCHTYDPSRPTGFPQISPAAHNPLKPCVGCHNPHDPRPPTVPHECKACHAEIARTKALSPHVLLDCTTCHAVPDAHRETPRLVASTIPGDRAFCGKCHGEDSSVQNTPKIDLLVHGEKYLCWQCHYPHMPEVE